MPKTTVQDAALQAHIERARAAAEAAGVDNANIDKLLASGTVDLSNRDYLQYFQLTWNALDRLTTRQWEGDNKALAGAVPNPDYYKQMGYFTDAYDMKKAIPGFDYIPGDYMFDPVKMAQWVNFSEREQQAYRSWLGADTVPQSAGPAPAPGGGTGSSASYSGGGGTNYDGGTKSMAVGGGGYGGGQPKALGAPPPPPGMGGPGGFPPPPPMGGGYPGGGGGSISEGMNFFPQAEYDWFTQNLQGSIGADWMQHLFPMRGQMGAVMAGATEQLNALDNFQRQMMGVYQGLNLEDPKDARKAFAIQQELQMLGSKRTEIVDKMMRFKHYYDDNLKLMKDIKDEAVKAIMSITQNVR